MAILDNWFELNGIEYKDICNQLVGDEVANIVNDREKLYREYFYCIMSHLLKIQ